MKGRSKLLALVVVVVMFFGVSVSGYAEDTMTTEEKAQVLHDLGLFDGVSTVKFDPALDEYANREQAAKIVIDALGYEVLNTDQSVFIDVSSWAQPYVALAVSEGITNGVSEDEFGSRLSITARQLATWFDRVITGSETAWEDNGTLDNSVGISRGTLVDTTYEALQRVPSGSGKSLIETIIGADQSKLDIALAGGLIDPDSMIEFDNTKPAYLLAVDVIDSDSITISMSNKLNEVSAENVANYKLYTGNGLEKNPFEAITLTAVNEVTIDFAHTLSGNYIVVMDGVVDVKGYFVDDYMNFVVGSSRGIFSIEVSGDNRILVTYTVDVDEESAEKLSKYDVTDEDGDEKSIDKISWRNGNEVSITFKTDLKHGEIYTLAVTGISAETGSSITDSQDFMGNEYVKSVIVSGSREIMVTFSDDVNATSAKSASRYTLTDGDGTTYSIEDIDVSDDDEVTITFDEYLDPNSYKLVVSNVIDIDGSYISDEVSFTID